MRKAFFILHSIFSIQHISKVILKQVSMHATFIVEALGVIEVWIGEVSQLPDKDLVKAVELSFILKIFIYQ